MDTRTAYAARQAQPAALLVPQNLESERALIGSVMLDNDALLLVDIQPADFYLERHADIWYAVQSLVAAGQPVDFITLTSKLDNAGKLGKDGAAYLTGVIGEAVTAINAPAYAEDVKRAALCRKLVKAAGDIAEIAYHTQDRTADELVAAAHAALVQIETGGTGKNAVRLFDAITEFLPELQDYLSGERETWGLPTGLLDLDAYIGGLAYGEMTLIAADPGKGKTTLATTIATNAAMRGNAGILFSLEMQKRQLMLRFYAERGNVDTAMIRRGRLCEAAKRQMLEEVEKVQNMPLWITDEPHDTAAVLRDILRLQRLLDADGQRLEFAIVDYSGLLTDAPGKGDTEVVRQMRLSHTLKNIAKRTGVALVVVHTITREGNPTAPPSLRDLGWGRVWEYDCHTCLFPFHAEERTDFSAVIKVGKFRDGQPNKAIDAIFDGKRWRDAARP